MTVNSVMTRLEYRRNGCLVNYLPSTDRPRLVTIAVEAVAVELLIVEVGAVALGD